MSAQRDALEEAQARLKELEASPVTDEQLGLLASALEHEAEAYEQVLEKGERRALARDATGPAARLMTFGFTLLFVTPMVSMIGVSVSKQLRHEQAGAIAVMVLGVLLITATLAARARRSIAHLASAEWRFIARARRMAASMRALIAFET
jgi:hypothetical protein